MARKTAVMQAELPPTIVVDMVNAPPHYTAGEIECIDAIHSALGGRGFADYLRGQVIKYQWRLAHKGNALEDAQKSDFYGRRFIELLEANPGLYD
jgi:hypothetical protein